MASHRSERAGKLVLSVVLGVALLLGAVRADAAADDGYLAGYAAAVLERELHVPARSLRVQNGVVELSATDLSDADRDKVRRVLSAIPDVVAVRFVEPGGEATTPAPSRAARRKATLGGGGFLPQGELFAPLLADPRWPRFSAIYRYYIDDDQLDSVGAANFGATLPLYRDAALPDSARWETGIQAGVFSIFDLEADSKDLINSDFFVALFGSYRVNGFAALGRLLHQSSHLGDEFLLRNTTERVNLSYEGIDVKLSYDVPIGVRLYGGGSYLFDQDPTSLDPAVVQYGVEVTNPWATDDDVVSPVVAADFQNSEESHWSTQYSVLAGVQFERLRIYDAALLLGVEWFRGQSPNGQFYQRKVEWVGIGAHFYF